MVASSTSTTRLDFSSTTPVRHPEAVADHLARTAGRGDERRACVRWSDRRVRRRSRLDRAAAATPSAAATAAGSTPARGQRPGTGDLAVRGLQRRRRAARRAGPWPRPLVRPSTSSASSVAVADRLLGRGGLGRQRTTMTVDAGGVGLRACDRLRPRRGRPAEGEPDSCRRSRRAAWGMKMTASRISDDRGRDQERAVALSALDQLAPRDQPDAPTLTSAAPLTARPPRRNSSVSDGSPRRERAHRAGRQRGRSARPGRRAVGRARATARAPSSPRAPGTPGQAGGPARWARRPRDLDRRQPRRACAPGPQLVDACRWPPCGRAWMMPTGSHSRSTSSSWWLENSTAAPRVDACSRSTSAHHVDADRVEAGERLVEHQDSGSCTSAAASWTRCWLPRRQLLDLVAARGRRRPAARSSGRRRLGRGQRHAVQPGQVDELVARPASWGTGRAPRACSRSRRRVASVDRPAVPADLPGVGREHARARSASRWSCPAPLVPTKPNISPGADVERQAVQRDRRRRTACAGRRSRAPDPLSRPDAARGRTAPRARHTRGRRRRTRQASRSPWSRAPGPRPPGASGGTTVPGVRRRPPPPARRPRR